MKNFRWLRVFIILSLLLILQPASAQNKSLILSNPYKTIEVDWKKKSLEHILNTEDIYSDNYEGFFNKGLDEIRNKQYNEAITSFKKSLKNQNHITKDIPELNKEKYISDALFNIALCYQNLENTDSAKYYLNEIIKTNPYYVKAYVGLAEIRYLRNDVDGAISVIDSGLDIIPGNSELSYQLAVYYLLSNKTNKAKKIQEHLIETHPGYKNSYLLLGLIYIARSQYTNAINALTQSIDSNNNIMAYYIRGELYLYQKNYKDAYNDLQKYELTDSINPDIEYTLALLDLKYGNYLSAYVRFLRKTEMDITSSDSTFSPPSLLEFRSLLRIINSYRLPAGELAYVNRIFKEYYWKGSDAKNYRDILDDYGKAYPNSVFEKKLAAVIYYSRNNSGFQLKTLLKVKDSTYHIDEESDSHLKVYNKAIEADPDDAYLLFFKADRLSYLQQHHMVIQTLLNGIGLKGDYAYGYTILGKEYLLTENYDSALIYLTKAIDIYPSNTSAYIMRAKIYCAMTDDSKQAINNYKLYFKYVNSGSDKITDELIIFQKRTFEDFIDCYINGGEYDTSRLYLDKLLKLFPNDYQTYKYVADNYLKIGAYDESIAMYEKLIATEKVYYGTVGYMPYYLYQEGNAYAMKEDYEMALKKYEKASKLKKRDDAILSGMADCYRNLGDCKSALKLYDKSIAINPDNKMYYYGKALCLSHEHQYREAIQYFGKATFMDTTFAIGYEGTGKCFYKMGKYRQSIQFSKKALSIDHTLYDASFNIAISLLRLNYYDKAYQIYKNTKDALKNKPPEFFQPYVDELTELLSDEKLKTQATNILIDIFKYTAH